VAATASKRSTGVPPRFTGVVAEWLRAHSLLARRILLPRVNRSSRFVLSDKVGNGFAVVLGAARPRRSTIGHVSERH